MYRRAVERAVGSRHRQRRDREVGRDHRGVRQLERERDRDRARAGAQVEDAQPLAGRARARERRLDQVLGLRPRHQHPAIDAERPPVELLLAEEIGDRLALEAPLEQPLEAGRVVVAHRAARGEPAGPLRSTRGLERGGASPRAAELRMQRRRDGGGQRARIWSARRATVARAPDVVSTTPSARFISATRTARAPRPGSARGWRRSWCRGRRRENW